MWRRGTYEGSVFIEFEEEASRQEKTSEGRIYLVSKYLPLGAFVHSRVVSDVGVATARARRALISRGNGGGHIREGTRAAVGKGRQRRRRAGWKKGGKRTWRRRWSVKGRNKGYRGGMVRYENDRFERRNFSDAILFG